MCAFMNVSQCVRDCRDSQSVDLQFSHQHDLGDCNQGYNCATGLLSNLEHEDLLLVSDRNFSFHLLGGWGYANCPLTH